jgi:hypothetical protein
MQRSDEKSEHRRAAWDWTVAILAFPAVILIILGGLAVGYRGASEWISAAVQAEFANSAAPPVQISQPVVADGKRQDQLRSASVR